MKRWLSGCLLALGLILCMGSAMADPLVSCGTCKQWMSANVVGYGWFGKLKHCYILECTGCGRRYNGPTESHSGGTENCSHGKICEKCNGEYTSPLDHDWGEWKPNGNGEHTRTCKNDGSHTQTEACSGGTATCTEKAVCSVCKAAYGAPLDHDWGEWKSNGNGEHTRTCKRDGSHTQTDSCSGGTATCIAKAVCTACGAEYGEIAPDNHDIVNHDGKAATCTEKGWDDYDTCKRCDYTTYHELPALNHDLVHHEAKAATCTKIGWEAYDTCKREGCNYTTYEEISALNHDPVQHDAKAPTCAEVGWNAYETCKRCNYTTYSELSIDPNNHDLVHHEAKAATCAEIGWNEYDTCTRCKYTTYSELSIDPDNHDLVHHEAKAATCTEVGWEAYATCKRDGCEYTTYSELSIDPDNHDLVHHEAKAANCTEIGWNEYDTCTRCDYTTYAELPALGHDYQKTVVQPTCEKGGYIRYTCARCEDTYTENPVKKLLHWYGEWSPNGDGTHSADCRREGCKHTGKVECETFEYRLLFADAEDYAFELCPVCGEVSDGARLALVTEAVAKAEHLPQGELVLRLNELQNGEHILSVGFEYSGKLTQPTEPVEITLPAELLEGYTPHILAADGTETELPFTVTEDTATFTLNFDAQDEIPVRMIRLVPAS